MKNLVCLISTLVFITNVVVFAQPLSSEFPDRYANQEIPERYVLYATMTAIQKTNYPDSILAFRYVDGKTFYTKVKAEDAEKGYDRKTFQLSQFKNLIELKEYKGAQLFFQLINKKPLNLPELRVLDIRSISFGDSLIMSLTANCKKLTTLRVKSLYDEKLPNILTRLPELEFLQAEQTHFANYDIDSMSRLKNMKHLKINVLDSLELLKIYELKNLESIDIGVYRNYNFPVGLSKLTKLKRYTQGAFRTIKLYAREVQILPDELGQLANLECLIFRNNPFGLQFPDSLQELKKLKVMILDHINLKNLMYFPEENQLEILFMEFDKMTMELTGDINLEQLKQLKTLVIFGRSMTFNSAVLDDIRTLKQLEYLRLEISDFTMSMAWEYFQSFDQLKLLCVMAHVTNEQDDQAYCKLKQKIHWVDGFDSRMAIPPAKVPKSLCPIAYHWSEAPQPDLSMYLQHLFPE